MPEEGKTISIYIQDKNSLKAVFLIYADTESLLEKIYACNIIQTNLPQQK